MIDDDLRLLRHHLFPDPARAAAALSLARRLKAEAREFLRVLALTRPFCPCRKQEVEVRYHWHATLWSPRSVAAQPGPLCYLETAPGVVVVTRRVPARYRGWLSGISC